ncbi:MAG: MTH938/NDUFAF3 family protein, partial [Candidatus Aminicenantes bacterium]|nr:MTH938/NDUFAF3 family protein [Candidatus Aminicenantes bacterium]
MRIDFYEFGRIIVNGQEYHHDLILLPDRIIYPWWRIEGHNLALIDLEDIWSQEANFFIIGTGAYGAVSYT